MFSHYLVLCFDILAMISINVYRQVLIVDPETCMDLHLSRHLAVERDVQATEPLPFV
jgi:hypothetical protein